MKHWTQGPALAGLFIFLAATVAAQDGGSSEVFLDQATARVQQYSETFHDLTAEETATMQVFDRIGHQVRARTVKSALVIYRSQKDARTFAEYRDVEEVDGRTLKRHQQRAVRKFQRLLNSASIADELEPIAEEGNRYNFGLRTANITLMQGIPLRTACRKGFVFRFLRNETVNSIETRVYSYSQI